MNKLPYHLLPESPKWQLVNGKLDLAEKTVKEAMKVQRVQATTVLI